MKSYIKIKSIKAKCSKFSKTEKFIFIRSSLVSTLLALGTFPVITRIYSPDTFGLYQVVISIGSIFSIFSLLRLEIFLAREKDEEKSIFTLCILILLFVVIALLSTDWISSIDQFFNISSSENFFAIKYLVAAFVFCSGILQIYRHILIKDSQYKILAKDKLLDVLSSQIIKITAGLLHSTAFILISSHILGVTVAAFNSAFHARSIRIELSLKKLFNAFRKVLRPAVTATFSAGCIALIASLPVFFISKKISLESVSFFYVANRLIDIPCKIISNAVVNFNISDSLGSDTKTNISINSVYRSSIKKMVFGVGGICLLNILAIPLYPLLLGKQWSAINSILILVTINKFFELIYLPGIATLITINKENVDFILNILFGLMLKSSLLYFSSDLNSLMFLLVLSSALHSLFHIASTTFLTKRFANA